MEKPITKNIMLIIMNAFTRIGRQLSLGSQLLWLWRISAISLVLLLIWVIGGNWLADQLERRMNREVSTYLEKFPRKEPNDSALKLFTYMAQLGLHTGLEKTAFDSYGRYFREQPNLATNLTPRQRESFQSTLDEAKNYIDSLPDFPDRKFSEIPESTKSYLSNQSSTLSSISKYLTTGESPEWGSDLEFHTGSLDTVAPSYLSLADLSTLLLVNGVQKYKNDLQEEFLEDLHASWIIHESLHKDSTLLLPQLVSTIVGGRQIKVLERIDTPASLLDKHLLNLNYRESIIKSIQNELFMVTTILARRPENIRLAWDPSSDLFFAAVQRIPQVLMSPYIRLSAINAFYIQQGSLDRLLLESPCSSSEFSFDIPWWDGVAKIILPSFLHVPHRGTELMLRYELLQKFWEIKAIASSTGVWPQKMSAPESTVCPGERWDYTVQDNEMFITFSQTPDWLQVKIDEGTAAPLEYRRALDQS